MFGQEWTVSKTDGKLFAMPGWEKSMEAKTLGVDFIMSYPVVQKGRKDYEMGLKCNFTRVYRGVAGDRVGISGYFTSPIAENLDFQVGTGLGMYTRPWQKTHDPKNKYISTYLNCVIDFGLVYTMRLSDDNEMIVGAKFVHNSNGWIAKPNMGLNYVQTEVGYRIRNDHGKVNFGDSYRNSSHWFILLSGGVCVPSTGLATNRDLSPAYCIQGGYLFAYQDKRSFGLSLDWGWNYAENFRYTRTGETPPVPITVGICPLHESYFGPVGIRVGIGCYLYDSLHLKRIYERVGVYYRLPDGDEIGLSVKARLTRADFIEWGYSISI